MLYIIVLIPACLLVLFGIFKITRKVRDKVETAKVINMSLYRTKKTSVPNKSACSFCRKKEKKLAFYSDEQGRVVGVVPFAGLRLNAER
ncbi:hypothetical protein [Paenibacillus planticolens]|uniref:Uncharacterized protein n=1 Tax=Paenibacillus planticolens TaxID=2654976 RepID=A0ABX1ZQ07_9BACL|nr:hypothetical protein [Paenibacillus planticolens]NOV02157.1 hypothetical protein [Paenibacillus planticolens]